MNRSKKRMELLANADISTALLKLGIPTLAGTMISALYNVVDAFWVGKLGTLQTAAVSIVYPLTMLGMAFGMLFGSGANSNIARFLGKKEYGKVKEYSSTAVFTGIGTITVLVAGMLLFLEPLLRLLGATEGNFVYAKEYAVIFIIGLIFNVFNMSMNNIIVAEGNPSMSMAAMLAGGITNLALDPILIFGCNMGVRGAAVATLISRLVSAAIYLSYLMKGASYVALSPRYFKPSMELYREVFKIGLPFCFFQLLNGFAVSLTNIAAKPFGDAAIATMGIVNRIMSLEAQGLYGFFKGYSPLVGFNYGAGNIERVKKATKTAIQWSTVANIIFGGICIVFAEPLIYLFNQESAEVLNLGTMALRVNGISYLALGFQIVINNYFLAIGKAKQGAVLSICRQGLFFIPNLLVFSSIWGITGVILSQLAADVCSTILTVILWKNELGKMTSQISAVKQKKGAM